MTTSDDAASPVQAICARLAGALDGALSWEWDGRFGAVLTAFGSEHQKAMLAELDACFDTPWSFSELKTAPHQVAGVAKMLGGLRSGQMLLTAHAGEAGPMLFCAWWPWGSGNRFSIRVGAVAGTDAVDDGELDASLKGWFGIA